MQIAGMEMAYNFKKLGQLFQVHLVSFHFVQVGHAT